MKHCQISDEIASQVQSYGARDFNPLKYKGEGWTRARKNRAKNTFSEAEKTFLFVSGKGKKNKQNKSNQRALGASSFISWLKFILISWTC